MRWSANCRGGFTEICHSLMIGSVCYDVCLRCGAGHFSGEDCFHFIKTKILFTHSPGPSTAILQ